MSTKAWPAGTLRAALVDAHRRYPDGSAPQLARIVGCDPGCARVILRAAGISVRKAKPQRTVWTAKMRTHLIQGAREQIPVSRLAEDLGVATSTLVLGAMALLREAYPQ